MKRSKNRWMTMLVAAGTATIGLGGLAVHPAAAEPVSATANTPVVSVQSTAPDLDLGTGLVEVQKRKGGHNSVLCKANKNDAAWNLSSNFCFIFDIHGFKFKFAPKTVYRL